MAHTCRDIINRALKRLGVLRAGGEASAADAADALASLSSLYAEWVGAGTFGRVFNVPITDAFSGEVGPNTHVSILTAEAVDIDLPATIPWDYWCNWRPERDYGWGLWIPWNGVGNVPRDKAVVAITSQENDTRATYVYDGTVQRWMRIDGLSMTDEAPLSARNPDGLSATLAVRIADFFGLQPPPATVAAANRYRTDLVTRFGNEERYVGEFH